MRELFPSIALIREIEIIVIYGKMRPTFLGENYVVVAYTIALWIHVELSHTVRLISSFPKTAC
jgi:hypothetical protein